MTEREQVVLNGRYELHRRVGRGGMAEVYLARDRLLDRLVAIKILFPEFATDPSFVARFRREAQAAANLNHPNIVGVYDWGKERGTYYIVMEYVDGRSVSDMIRNDGPLEPKKAAAIAADVAGALGFAHRKGVVHRDVKPGNVLITKAGEVKVADFGIARAMTSSGEADLTQTGSVMGTATYFSPEQAQGKPVDARTDLYSLGVVLYEMVAGKPPFSGDSPVAIAYQHVQEPIPPLSERAPGVPSPYEAIVMRALAKDADARYPDGAAMRSDLLRFRDGRPISAGRAAAAGAAAGAAVGAAGAAAVGAGGAATSAVPATQAPLGPTAGGDDPTSVEDAIPNKRTGWFFVVIILLFVVLGGLLVVFGNQLGIFDQQTKSVTMPRVVDMQIEEATQELEALDLVVETADRESEEPVGTVLEQSPAPGEQVEEGSTVVLTISVGIGSATVPEVSGLTELQATEALEEAGFTNISTEPEEADDPAQEGFVLRSEPNAGEVVLKNQLIVVIVASAPAPTTTTAPPTTTSPPTTAAPTTTTTQPATTTTTTSTTTTTTSTTTTTTTTTTVP